MTTPVTNLSNEQKIELIKQAAQKLDVDVAGSVDTVIEKIVKDNRFEKQNAKLSAQIEELTGLKVENLQQLSKQIAELCAKPATAEMSTQTDAPRTLMTAVKTAKVVGGVALVLGAGYAMFVNRNAIQTACLDAKSSMKVAGAAMLQSAQGRASVIISDVAGATKSGVSSLAGLIQEGASRVSSLGKAPVVGTTLGGTPVTKNLLDVISAPVFSFSASKGVKK